VVTHRLQVERRTGKFAGVKTDVLPLSYAAIDFPLDEPRYCKLATRMQQGTTVERSVNGLIFVTLAGDNSAMFGNGLRTIFCRTSNVRRNNDRKLLGGRYVLPRAAGLSRAELGPSSADCQSHRSTKHTAVLVRTKLTVTNTPLYNTRIKL